MTTEILLAGFGGQGVLFTGKILAYCALTDGKELSWLPSYGPEMRGGTANCSVCVSDEPIGSPLVTAPDILVAMNQPSFDKFINAVKPNGFAFIDSSLVESKCERKDISCYYLPSTSMANENGLQGGSNMILLGKIIKETKIFTLDTVKKAIEKVVPPTKEKLIKNNFKAIELGMNE